MRADLLYEKKQQLRKQTAEAINEDRASLNMDSISEDDLEYEVQDLGGLVYYVHVKPKKKQ